VRSKKSKDTPQLSFIEQARRRQIIEASIACIAEEGYAGASLAKIAGRVGIGKSVVLYHFKGKDALLRATVERIYEELWAFVRPRLETEKTAGRQLRVYIESEFAFLERHRGQLLALSFILPNHRDTKGRLALLEESQAVYMQFVCSMLERGQKSGEFRDFAPRPMAATLMHSINGALEEWVRDPALSLSAYSDELVQIFDRATRR
jgi:AcrR family transcriptional regulator